MEENLENREYQETQPEAGWEARPAGLNRGLLLGVGAVALLIVAGLAFGYGYRQQIAVGHLTAQQTVANATIDQLQGQLNNVNTKLNDMVAAQQQAAEQAAAEKKAASSPGAKHGPADKRYKQLQAQLQDQEKQLKETQDLVAKNRTDLETSLSSTKDELNGSIAKTHDELVVLEKRGERNYFEFDLRKSRQFERFGPITLSLRRTDAKHMNYDLMMVVDDKQLGKKRVNLYEPIWIHTESPGQPVQVVVNRISKNAVHGYISAPKYKESDLAAAGAGAPTLTPVSATTQDPNRPNPQPEQPQPEQQQPPSQQPQTQPPQPQHPQ
jgi:hypothetical protein